MQETIGKDWSSSRPSSWLDENAHVHNSPHFLLIVYPDGRLILTTPSFLKDEDFERIRTVVSDWMDSSDSSPLMIGDCQVVMQSVRPKSAEVVRRVG